MLLARYATERRIQGNRRPLCAPARLAGKIALRPRPGQSFLRVYRDAPFRGLIVRINEILIGRLPMRRLICLIAAASEVALGSISKDSAIGDFEVRTLPFMTPRTLCTAHESRCHSVRVSSRLVTSVNTI